MPKRSSKKPADEPHPETTSSETAPPAPEPQQAQDAPTQPAPDGKNPAAVALGKLGGKKGGPARAAKLSEEERKEIAKKAARARWEKKKGS